VIDCRPAGRIKPADAAAFAATVQASAEIGWRYEFAHEPDLIRRRTSAGWPATVAPVAAALTSWPPPSNSRPSRTGCCSWHGCSATPWPRCR
jgi:hypothetical protein